MKVVKEARERMGITQSQLGAMLGVGNQFVHHWEKGVAGMPPQHFKKVSKILSIPVEKLIAGAVSRYRESLMKKAGLK